MTASNRNLREPGLVLTRKVGERVRIGHHIEIAVLDTHRGHAFLAVNAPKNVLFYCEENRGRPVHHRFARKAREARPPRAPLGAPELDRRPAGVRMRRSDGTSIIIAPNIKVTLQEAWARKVSLRIHAPADIPVFRAELYGTLIHQHLVRRAGRARRATPHAA